VFQSVVSGCVLSPVPADRTSECGARVRCVPRRVLGRVLACGATGSAHVYSAVSVSWAVGGGPWGQRPAAKRDTPQTRSQKAVRRIRIHGAVRRDRLCA
jgi:hypothetical protein